jgi:glycosyltransferase involved in cell wall biosynthesis
LDVLIPHHRDVQGLSLSLAAVRAQTWSGDIRIVVADDGSPKKELHAVRALLEDQPLPFELLRNDQNRGRPYTRNRLLDSIEGEYVAWLDVGDVWYPEKIALQFEHIYRLRFAGRDMSRIWVTCDYDWQREGARRYVVQQVTEGDQLRELFLGERLRAYLWTLLAPADTFRAVGRFDEQLPRLQDLDYFIRFVRAGGIISNVPKREPLCLYQKSDVGRSAHEIRRCNQRIFAKHRTSFERYGREFISTTRCNAERLSARYAKHNGDTLGRLYYIGKAFMARPGLVFGLARSRVARFGH